MNRVETIKRIVRWTDFDEGIIPLYHIPGSENLADLVSKKHAFDLSLVDFASEWQNGKPWMKTELSHMPAKSYKDIVVEKSHNIEIMLRA